MCHSPGGESGAFTLGELLNPQTVVIHLEKANPEIQGLYALINQQFLEKEWSETPWSIVSRTWGNRPAQGQGILPSGILVEKFTLFIPA